MACTEEKKPSLPKTAGEKIQGDWTGVKHSIYSYNSASGDTSFALDEFPNDFWARFSADGSYLLVMERNTINDTSRGSYQLEGSMLGLYSEQMDSTTALLLKLDENSLIFEVEEIDSNDVYEAYYEFMR